MKNIFSLLLATALLANAAPPNLGTASGASAARDGSNIVAATFRGNLGLGTAATTNATAYATAAQGSTADSAAQKAANLSDLVNAATARTNLGLGTAATTSSGDYATALQGSNADAHAANTSNPHSVTKTQVGLGSVENTALSTWAGTTNIVTLGTVTTGSFPAANIAGATLASGVTSSSLTSFGNAPSMTSPDITTNITTPSTTFGIVNANATTVTGFGAATSINLGFSTATATHSYSTGATLSGNTKTINIGTAGASGSTTAISIGSAVSGATSTVSLFGRFVSNAVARSSGTTNYFQVAMPADTGITASTESIGVNFLAGTRTWAAGAITTQRERVFGAPTIAFASASTVTTAVNLDVADPVAGTNATLTNKYAIRTASLNVTGATTLGGAINNVTITAPASGSTLTIADGKTLTANNSITIAGTDGVVMTTPSTSFTAARTDAANTFTGVQSMTSPAITTSITTPTANFTLFNTTATTISAFGAATTMTLGGTPTGAITHNYSTNATATATTKTVNLATGGAAGSTTNINLGSANGGTTTITSPTLAFGAATQLQPPLGAVGTPTYSFTGDSNTGMWSAGSDTLNFTVGGAGGATINTTGFGIGVTPTSKLHVADTQTNPAAIVNSTNLQSSIIANSGSNGFVNNGLTSQLTLSGSQNFTASSRGASFATYYGGSAVVSELVAFLNAGGCTSTGNITTFVANRIGTFSTGAGTIGTAIGLQVNNMSAYSSPTTAYGVKLEDNTTAVGTSKYGLYIGSVSGAATNNYSIYTGTAPSYFGGNIEIGNTSDTTIARVSAGVVSIEGVNISTVSSTDTLTNKTSSYCKIANTTVGALTAAATAGLGAQMIVTDSLAPTVGSTVAAGGSAKAMVTSNGTNWIVTSPL